MTFIALACLACGALSCSRQLPRTTVQPNASPAAQAAQQSPPAQVSPPQSPAAKPEASAAIVVAPGQAAQTQLAAGQPPDRMLNSGHTAAVTAVAFSSDRRFAATGGEDKTIRIWDLATATQLRVLTGHTDRVEALAFSPDGSRLASTAGDGTVRVWDPASGSAIYSFNLPNKFGEQVAFTADGKILAASAGASDEGGNSYIELRDAATGAQIRRIILDWNNATPLVITPDGRLLSSGGAGEDGEYISAKIWDLVTGRELKTLQAFFSGISSDGRWGASLEFQQGTQVNLWDIAAGRTVRTINIQAFNASRAVFTPDGSHILVQGQDFRNGKNSAEGKVFEVATGKELESLPIPSGTVAFTGDGKWLAAASGSSVEILDLVSGRELETLAGQLAAQDLVFTPDGKLLITGGTAMGIWDIASSRLTRTVPAATQSLVLSSDGRWLAANPSGNLEIWDTKTWTRVAFEPVRLTPSPATSEQVWWFGFADLHTGFSDPVRLALRWWQIGSGSDTHTLWGATFASALSPNEKFVATAALRQPAASQFDRPNVSLWEASTGRLLQMLAAHDVGVAALTFSPDGQWLATAGQESRIDPAHVGASLAGMKRSLKLWDTNTWQLRASLLLVGPGGGGLGTFSPDGRLLALTSQNGVTLYDVPELRAIKTFPGAGGAVRFSPDGQWLARGSGAGIALWNLATLAK